jgi:hypothetical protein
MGTPAPGCNGTVYNILKQGSGAEVVKGAQVTVHATGSVPRRENKAATAGQGGPGGRLAEAVRLASVPPWAPSGAGEVPFWPNVGGLVF